MEERERLWSIFASDPEWIEARKAHQLEHGEVVANISNTFLAPTAFSTMRKPTLGILFAQRDISGYSVKHRRLTMMAT